MDLKKLLRKKRKDYINAFIENKDIFEENKLKTDDKFEKGHKYDLEIILKNQILKMKNLFEFCLI